MSRCSSISNTSVQFMPRCPIRRQYATFSITKKSAASTAVRLAQCRCARFTRPGSRTTVHETATPAVPPWNRRPSVVVRHYRSSIESTECPTLSADLRPSESQYKSVTSDQKMYQQQAPVAVVSTGSRTQSLRRTNFARTHAAAVICSPESLDDHHWQSNVSVCRSSGI